MPVLTPREIIDVAARSGNAKIAMTRNAPLRLLTLAVLAGAYIALGGALSTIVGFGFPEATAANPSLQKFLSGCVFPVGLILVVVLGAELFTGNNALLMPPYMQRSCTTSDVLKNWTIVYLGNFIGAVLFTYLFVYAAGLTSSGPYHEAAVKVATAKVSMPWLAVFLRGVAANWCVCLAIWLALAGRRLLEKMAACWLPVMTFVALGYEHSIANMYFIPIGMMEGADITVWQAVWSNLIPATLGNIVGGALLIGAVQAALHLPRPAKP